MCAGERSNLNSDDLSFIESPRTTRWLSTRTRCIVAAGRSEDYFSPIYI